MPVTRLVARLGVAPATLTRAPGRRDSTIAVLTRGSRRVELAVSDAGHAVLRDAHSTIATGTGPMRIGQWSTLTVTERGSTLEVAVDARSPELPIAAWTIVVATGTAHGPDDGGFRGGVAVGDAIPDPGTPFDVVEWLASCATTDPAAPRIHYRPPALWMNEPHGLIELDGRFHQFHQSNRRSASWHAIEWAHASSSDLVRWEHHPPALVPSPDGPMPTGVWSGSTATDADGSVLAFVTAGDAGRSPDQSVVRARALDKRLLTWEVEASPALTAPAEVSGRPLIDGQFRDPFVWREGSAWFCLIGSGTIDVTGGAALLYRSDDAVTWSGPTLMHGASISEFPDLGEMWELPVLLPVHGDGDSAHVLLVCPWWRQVPTDQTVQVWYWVGDFDPAAGRFAPRHREPRRFDHGHHFTGPSGSVIGDGRSILFSIAQDGRTDSEHVATGWAHNAGFPLELGLARGDLIIAPVRELRTLRGSEIRGVPDVRLVASSAELWALAEPGFALTCRDGGRTLAVVTLHRLSDGWSLHCRRPYAASFDQWFPEEDHTVALRCRADRPEVRAVIDGSMLEIYVHETDSYTTRIRPTGPTEVATAGAVDSTAWPLSADPAAH